MAQLTWISQPFNPVQPEKGSLLHTKAEAQVNDDKNPPAEQPNDCLRVFSQDLITRVGPRRSVGVRTGLGITSNSLLYHFCAQTWRRKQPKSRNCFKKYVKITNSKSNTMNKKLPKDNMKFNKKGK